MKNEELNEEENLNEPEQGFEIGRVQLSPPEHC
jgi:hypothetical protein